MNPHDCGNYPDATNALEITELKPVLEPVFSVEDRKKIEIICNKIQQIEGSVKEIPSRYSINTYVYYEYIELTLVEKVIDEITNQISPNILTEIKNILKNNISESYYFDKSEPYYFDRFKKIVEKICFLNDLKELIHSLNTVDSSIKNQTNNLNTKVNNTNLQTLSKSNPEIDRNNFYQTESRNQWYEANSVDYDDGGKYWGYGSREYGNRFGSYPMFDDYGDESSP